MRHADNTSANAEREEFCLEQRVGSQLNRGGGEGTSWCQAVGALGSVRG